MLTTLEKFLFQILKSLISSNMTLLIGQSANALNLTKSFLSIRADNLQLLKNAQADNQRDTVFFTKRYAFQANPLQLEFFLPDDETGEVLEVEFVGGKLAKLHDDYKVENKKVGFYCPPAVNFTVLVRKELAHGYQQIQPCTVDLWLESCDLDRVKSEDILSKALAASLTAFIDVDRLELTQALENLSLRLIKPELELIKLLSNLEPAANKGYIFKALLRVNAQLEERVILGMPEKDGYIEKINIREISLQK